MDIPLFKELGNKTPIEIQTPNGNVQLIPFRLKRGTGNKKWCLSIDGITRQSIDSMAQCFIYFRGAELGGHFAKAHESNGVWRVTFETIIPMPEFWEQGAGPAVTKRV